MNDPFLKAISVSGETGYTGSGKDQFLSIELALDGFSFGIFDSRNLRPLLIESYNIRVEMLPVQLAVSLHEFIIKCTALLSPFEKVNLAWYHQQYTLIPNELYHPLAKEAYHSLCAQSPEGFMVTSDELSNLYAYGIYPFPEILNHKLRIIYPNLRVRHLATVLIEYALTSINLEKGGHDIFLHIRPKHFEVLIFNYKRLVFYNSFPYQAFDDLMYFLFYVLEQFRLDSGKMNAFIAGKISEDSVIFQSLLKYFRSVSSAPAYPLMHQDNGFEQVPKDIYQNLVSLAICE